MMQLFKISMISQMKMRYKPLRSLPLLISCLSNANYLKECRRHFLMEL